MDAPAPRLWSSEVSKRDREMRGRLELDEERELRAPDGRQQLRAGLDGALRPAMLLRLEAVHVDRELGRRHEVGEEDEAPAVELRAV